MPIRLLLNNNLLLRVEPYDREQIWMSSGRGIL
jgi:hypothetical protein